MTAPERPSTAAGRALLDNHRLQDGGGYVDRDVLRDAILAIEAEARAECDALLEALEQAQKGLGSVLWLANNVQNATAQPIRFREFFDAMTEDVRNAYNIARAALAGSADE